MFEAVVLGLIQGVTEWLPVSSEGMIVLSKIHLFGGGGVNEIIHLALFLHLGTFLSALLYLRKEVFKILKSFVFYRRAKEDEKKLLRFLVISTMTSGVLGFILLKIIEGVDNTNFLVHSTSKYATVIIGALLIITGLQLLKARRQNIITSKSFIKKRVSDIDALDGLLVGMAQGLAALPGLSRSGLTVASLLMRKFDDAIALKISFLMSLPIVLFGNFALNFNSSALNITPSLTVGLVVSFISGLATIHLLLGIARRVNFAYFTLLFGFAMLMFAFI